MVDVVEAIVKRLVDDPDDVQITSIEGTQSTIIEVDVHPDDRGKIIGKGGCIAKAMRTILAAASGRENKKYTLEIIEDEVLGDEADADAE